MNKYLSQLVELKDIDQKIDSFDPEIEKIKTNLNIQLKKERALQKRIEDDQETLDNNVLSRTKNEQHLEELVSKIKGMEARSASLKTEKEIKALQLEEEIAKEQIEFANEEIERLDKIEVLKKREIEEAQESIDAMQCTTKDIADATEIELANLEKERMQVYEDKQKLVSNMSQNIIVFYEKIRRWAGNTTVVPVKKQACYGCYMKLNDHSYSEVIRSEEIQNCPHCGRILYLEPTELEGEESK